MSNIVCNCIVCAKEFDSSELQGIASSKINVSSFKICQACLEACDPSDDYRIAQDIVSSYLRYAEAKTLFNEVKKIIKSQ